MSGADTTQAGSGSARWQNGARDEGGEEEEEQEIVCIGNVTAEEFLQVAPRRTRRAMPNLNLTSVLLLSGKRRRCKDRHVEEGREGEGEKEGEGAPESER
eukprot:3209067-Rhodomonas_salina.3